MHVALYGLYGYRPFFRTMPGEYRDRIRELADVVGLGDEVFRPLKTYSGGMKRKLEIIRSLMHRPSVLFLDEPTSGLDPVSRHSLWQYLRSVRNTDSTTIFLTTHYLEEAEEADRVCVIDHGRIAMIGTPDEMKAALLERSIELDAADRRAVRRARDARSAADRRRGRPRPCRLRRRHRPLDHLPDLDAPQRPPRPRPQPRGGLCRAPPLGRSHRGRPGGRSMTATSIPTSGVAREGISSRFGREVNATFAIAWREVLRAVKSPLSIAFTVIFPVIFIGILGGSISQNLSGALPYAYLPFMLIGMIANTMYQGTITA
jgi:hypothetical protein